ncbi:MAG: hypothetical protein HWN81_03330 [Candidatus Lokiarchaeota archaeon]|nr:hypothetical protein [Candidatus Lokiarchaeota archaeon]
MAIDEVKRKDLGEALEYIGKFFVEFRDIEGLKYQAKVFNTLNEAMSLIGKG